MKTIKSGSVFTIYGDDLEVFDKLPVGYYDVCFDKMSRFSLRKRNDLEITDKKLYGPQLCKTDKILNRFVEFNRNMGVLLSGDKGLGKTVFTKLLAQKAINQKIPVLVVTERFDGLPAFLDSITQPVMIVIDEFEKIYVHSTARDTNSTQNELLSMLDGLSSGKKLFVLTCNDINQISQFYIGRPGRIYYHIAFKYPTKEEIREYLQDAILPDYHSDLDQIVKFSRCARLNYDCLRAITFEVNAGVPLSEVLEDLNIDVSGTYRYKYVLTYADGKVDSSEITVNFVKDTAATIRIRGVGHCCYGYIRIPMSSLSDEDTISVSLEDITIEWKTPTYDPDAYSREDFDYILSDFEKLKTTEMKSLTLTCMDKRTTLTTKRLFSGF